MKISEILSYEQLNEDDLQNGAQGELNARSDQLGSLGDLAGGAQDELNARTDQFGYDRPAVSPMPPKRRLR
jgi:hypothetical protein